MIKTVRIPGFKRYSILLTLCVLPILNACGGGLGGSGDGGASSRTVILPPELGSDPLIFRSVPETVLVDLPDSLFDVTNSTAASGSTLHELGDAVSDVNTYKTETALLQLVAEASWSALQTHCDSTPIDTACVFSADQILTTYTNEMASWEYVTKYDRYQESLGSEPVSSADTAELTSLIMAKINTEHIDRGLRQETQLNFNRVSNDVPLQMQAQITKYGTDNKTDIYLLGRAGDDGGYVESELVYRNVNDIVSHQFTRQGFDTNSELKSFAICDNKLSASECTMSNSQRIWTVLC